MAKISRRDFYLIALAIFLLVILGLLAAFRSRLIIDILISAITPQETFFLLPKSSNSENENFLAAATSSNSHIVYITPDGFNPKSLTIQSGDTVRWLNTDIELHWPASDPHPTHTASPGFDAGGNLSQFEVYFHVFTKPGFFVYHDHNQALSGSTSTITGLIKAQ
ncbi:MAG: hypothetical protein AAB772_00285 [Patescibacteria group bacterium]